jgi:hypothetical protein
MSSTTIVVLRESGEEEGKKQDNEDWGLEFGSCLCVLIKVLLSSQKL